MIRVKTLHVQKIHFTILPKSNFYMICRRKKKSININSEWFDFIVSINSQGDRSQTAAPWTEPTEDEEKKTVNKCPHLNHFQARHFGQSLSGLTVVAHFWPMFLSSFENIQNINYFMRDAIWLSFRFAERIRRCFQRDDKIWCNINKIENRKLVTLAHLSSKNRTETYSIFLLDLCVFECVFFINFVFLLVRSVWGWKNNEWKDRRKKNSKESSPSIASSATHFHCFQKVIDKIIVLSPSYSSFRLLLAHRLQCRSSTPYKSIKQHSQRAFGRFDPFKEDPLWDRAVLDEGFFFRRHFVRSFKCVCAFWVADDRKTFGYHH